MTTMAHTRIEVQSFEEWSSKCIEYGYTRRKSKSGGFWQAYARDDGLAKAFYNTRTHRGVVLLPK